MIQETELSGLSPVGVSFNSSLQFYIPQVPKFSGKERGHSHENKQAHTVTAKSLVMCTQNLDLAIPANVTGG
jgi:hypothetical protein